MESRMSHSSKRVTRALVVLAVVAVSLLLAGAASAEFPTVRANPGVIGTPTEGQTLNGTNGQWLYDSGLKCEPGDCTYSYNWQRCNADDSGCVDVAGRTGFTYLLGAEDVGKKVRFVETVFKRDCGAHNSQTGEIECHDITKNSASTPFGPINPKPVTTAQATAPPTLAGLAMEDETLRATGGTWTGPGTITKAFFWQRCNAIGEGCSTLPGATGATHKLTSEDVGTRLRVIEVATNEGGSSQAVSSVSAVVIELKPTASRPTIAASKVELPHRLIVDRLVARQAGKRVTLRIRVSDDRGFHITGIIVRAQPTGLLAGSTAARATDSTGWATFTYTATGSGTTYVFAEAAKRGERPQSGTSSSNLFKVRVR
jgi:hypothetical protein